ncbi:hypothetical protein [Nocardia sp. NPDC004750]
MNTTPRMRRHRLHWPAYSVAPATALMIVAVLPVCGGTAAVYGANSTV